MLVGYLSRRLGCPVRLIEDRLENMRGGDAHGPERMFDIEAAFDGDGVVRSMKMRALDNVGAYAGRSPFQLGKPVGAIVGPYRINSVQYQAIAVITNKTVQEAVRGVRPGADQLRDRANDRRGRDTRSASTGWSSPAQPDPHEEFPYLIPSGTTYDSGDYETVVDKVMAPRHYQSWLPSATGCAERACWPELALPPVWSRTAAIHRSSRCSIRRSRPRPGWSRAASASISPVGSPRPCTRPRRARGTRRWSRQSSARRCGIDPDTIRVTRPDSLTSLPSNSPVGSRMAVMLGGAAFHAANKLKDKLVAIGAHELGIPKERAAYRPAT